MIFRFSSKVLEDTLFPITLHMIPVLNHAVPNRIIDAVGLRVGHGLVPDMEIEILDAALGGKMRGLRWNRRAPPTRAGRCSCV